MKKLYDVTFTFDPKDYEQVLQDRELNGVGLLGSFCFYKSGLTGNTDETGMVDCDEYFGPADYREDLDNIGHNYYQAMEKQEDGTYALTLKLPANLYQYNFVINPVTAVRVQANPADFRSGMVNVLSDRGEIALMTMKTRFQPDPELGFIVKDVKHDDKTPTLGGYQNGSMIYVGEASEHSWLPIADETKKGTVTYQAYTDIDGVPRTFGVYLPAGYDRMKTYPLIVVSHGGGGNESDWVWQGGINNIMDNLIAEGKTKEAILVFPSNAVYIGTSPIDWLFEKIARNTEECILPLVEKIYSVSRDVKDRAFCGLSMGSMTTLYMYYHRTSVYQYYGAFSGGIAPGHPAYDISGEGLKDVTLMIGSAEEDIAYNQNPNGVPPTIRALQAAGLPIIPWFSTASHDWYCWPQMFEHFAEYILWK